MTIDTLQATTLIVKLLLCELWHTTHQDDWGDDKDISQSVCDGQ
jgi:hypothetical protein